MLRKCEGGHLMMQNQVNISISKVIRVAEEPFPAVVLVRS